jgi:hypothetical protein
LLIRQLREMQHHGSMVEKASPTLVFGGIAPRLLLCVRYRSSVARQSVTNDQEYADKALHDTA